MPRPKTDLIGQTFGELTVVGPAENQSGQPRWQCRCICGATTTVMANNLKSGATTHCGTNCPKRIKVRPRPDVYVLLPKPPVSKAIVPGEIQLNDKFGWLCVVEDPDKSKVVCYCGCNNPIPIVVYRSKLLSGHKINCGTCHRDTTPFKILEGKESSLAGIRNNLESMGYQIFREISTRKILWQSPMFPIPLDKLPIHYRFQRFDTVWIPGIRQTGIVQNIAGNDILVKLLDGDIQKPQTFTPMQLFLIDRVGLEEKK